MGIFERKIREKKLRKASIINAAERIFFDRGIKNTTMDQIAKKAELSKGTLYLYFKNKEDLLLEIAVKGLEKLGELMNKAYNENKTGLDNAYIMGKTYHHFSIHHNNYYESLVHFESQTLDRIPSRKINKIIRTNTPLAILKQVLDKGKTDKTIRDDIPSYELSIILWTQFTGILQFIRSRKKLMDMFQCNEEDLVEHHLKIMKDSLASQSGCKNIKQHY
jgi:AcrR family transcriptional regulator